MPDTLSPDTLRLSAAAIMALRFEIRGWRSKVKERKLPAYRELVAAGIMEPVPGSGADFRFTDEGMARREEILREQEERVERERYEPPDAGNLSGEARELLGRIAAGRVEVTHANRAAFRELMAARIVILGHSFAAGRESVYGWTYWGWKLRFELLGGARESA